GVVVPPKPPLPPIDVAHCGFGTACPPGLGKQRHAVPEIPFGPAAAGAVGAFVPAMPLTASAATSSTRRSSSVACATMTAIEEPPGIVGAAASKWTSSTRMEAAPSRSGTLSGGACTTVLVVSPPHFHPLSQSSPPKTITFFVGDSVSVNV